MFANAGAVAGPVLTIETSAELAAGVTVMLQLLFVTVTGGASESLALALKEKGLPTAVVGVPVTAPVVVFRVKPAGSDPGVIENV
jgi:ABC-type transport system involved in cytochrome c biogenesis permease component